MARAQAEEHAGTGLRGDLLVLGELLALIPGQGPAQGGGQQREGGAQRLGDGLGR
jgi:hypothetical protein